MGNVHAKEERKHVNKRYDLRKRKPQKLVKSDKGEQAEEEQDAVFKHGCHVEIQVGKKHKRSSEGESQLSVTAIGQR